MFKQFLTEWLSIQELSERIESQSAEANELSAKAEKASEKAHSSGNKEDHLIAHGLHAKALHAHRMAAIHADASGHKNRDEMVKHHMAAHDKHVDAVRDHLKHDSLYTANAEKVKAAKEKAVKKESVDEGKEGKPMFSGGLSWRHASKGRVFHGSPRASQADTSHGSYQVMSHADDDHGLTYTPKGGKTQKLGSHKTAEAALAAAETHSSETKRKSKKSD